MKKLLIYINPDNKFVGENELLIKIQIDSSLELGWNSEDLWLLMNFSYEYRGIKAHIISADSFHAAHVQATKFTTLVSLFKDGLIKNELYWAPDLEAFQQEPITEAELEMDKFDFGLTTYGWSPYWCLGSIFFKKGAEPIFTLIRETMDKYQIDDERALRRLNINSKIKELNITYDFGMRHVDINYKQAHKPIKVVHFHPWHKRVPTLAIFMHGKNELGFPLMNQRLIKIFNSHGVA